MNRKRTPWWRRIDEKKLGIFGTRAGAVLVIAIAAAFVENPWLFFAVLAVATAGALFALVMRHSSRHEPPSLFKSPRE